MVGWSKGLSSIQFAEITIFLSLMSILRIATFLWLELSSVIRNGCRKLRTLCIFLCRYDYKTKKLSFLLESHCVFLKSNRVHEKYCPRCIYSMNNEIPRRRHTFFLIIKWVQFFVIVRWPWRIISILNIDIVNCWQILTFCLMFIARFCESLIFFLFFYFYCKINKS